MSGKIDIKIEGLDELRSALKGMDEEIDAAVQGAVEEAADEIAADVKRTLAMPGSPQTDTGKLARSVYRKNGDLEATVGSRLVYAQYLEFGTRKMQPRPMWIAASKRAGDRVPEKIAERLRRVLK